MILVCLILFYTFFQAVILNIIWDNNNKTKEMMSKIEHITCLIENEIFVKKNKNDTSSFFLKHFAFSDSLPSLPSSSSLESLVLNEDFQ